MKILFCTNTFEVVSNGPAKFAQLLLELYSLHPEHEIRILTEDISQSVPNTIYKLRLNIPSILKPLGMFLRMFLYHRTAINIRKTEFAFDVLVYNNAIVGLISGIRFKNTIGFINDDNNASANWKFPFKPTKAHVFFIVEKIATRYLRKTVANSKYLKQYLLKRYRVPDHKIEYLYKAIEIKPSYLEKRNAVTTILFVKNDYERGGLFILIEALNKLNQQIELTIIGPPHSAKVEILNNIQNTNITVNFMGIVPQSEVYEQMRQADIFCVPSLKEGLGVANIEAMAFGCSIISTNVGGIPEVLDNGNNGWMTTAGDAQSLYLALQSCMLDPQLREQKRKNAFNYIEIFQLETVLNLFVQIISKA